jgi:hypothetical protein
MVRMVRMDVRETLVIGVTRERKGNVENVENVENPDARVIMENVERKVTREIRVTKEIVGRRANKVKEVTMDVTDMMVMTVVMERRETRVKEGNVVKEGVLVRMANQVTDGLRLQDILSVLVSVLET